MVTDSQEKTNWDQAAGKAQDLANQESNEGARWMNRDRVRRDEQPAESSKDAERRGHGGRETTVVQGCKFCGMRNHNSEDCLRKVLCEICGYNNHNTYECRREPFWNVGPELCAAQVEDQSFFFIDEVKDPKVTMEKASTAIITVLEGEASAKQIEEEFKHTVSSKTWRWSARKIAENKYSMRFPDASMVQVYNNFKCLGMKEAEAKIAVEPWNSSVSAKGELQQAWFKVRGIPNDQRSIRTIAKVGGLVGKTVEIDEKSRFRNDYVRIKLACRDVLRVPPVAESSLGMMIYDFFYEREVPDAHQNKGVKIGVQTDAPAGQPSPKKLKTGAIPMRKKAQLVGLETTSLLGRLAEDGKTPPCSNLLHQKFLLSRKKTAKEGIRRIRRCQLGMILMKVIATVSASMEEAVHLNRKLNPLGIMQ